MAELLLAIQMFILVTKFATFPAFIVKQLSSFSQTLRKIFTNLFPVLIIIFITTACFSCLGYRIYGDKLTRYSSFYNTLKTFHVFFIGTIENE